MLRFKAFSLLIFLFSVVLYSPVQTSSDCDDELRESNPIVKKQPKAEKKEQGEEIVQSSFLLQLPNEILLFIAEKLDIRSLESLGATCRLLRGVANAAGTQPWLINYYTKFGYRYLVRKELPHIFGCDFARSMQLFIGEESPEMYEKVFRNIMIDETQTFIKSKLASVISEIQDPVALFLLTGHRQAFCLSERITREAIPRLVNSFHEKKYTPNEIKDLAGVLSANRSNSFSVAVPDHIYLTLIEKLIISKLPADKVQDFFRSMEENREQLFLRLSPWEKITLASALVPFSPEKISVIAQNHQRLFRDVIGHRTKNSILKAIQDAELTSAQIIEFAAALDRNRDSL